MLECINSFKKVIKTPHLNGINSVITTNITVSQLNINSNKPKSIDCWVKLNPSDLGFPNAGLYEIGSSVLGGQMSLRLITDQEENWRVQWFGTPDHDFLFEIPQRWFHVLQTYDGLFSKVYIDGVLVASEQRTDINVIDDGFGAVPLTIGAWNYGIGLIGHSPTQFLKGQIRDLRVWDIGKDNTDNLHNPLNIIQPNVNHLKLWYSLREGSGNLSQDITGNFPPAVLNNISWIPL